MRLLALTAAALLVPSLAVADGANVSELYRKKCAGCHGMDGRGETKMGRKYNIPDLSTGEWQQKHSDAQIRSMIVNGGKTKMPPWKDKLSAEEIDAMVQFVRGLGPK